MESDICFARLAWDDPRSGERHVLRESLALPAVAASEVETRPQNTEVMEQINLLEVARIRREAIAAMERGDMETARGSVQQGRKYVMDFMMESPASATETADLDEIAERLSENDVARASKTAKYQDYRRHHSR